MSDLVRDNSGVIPLEKRQKIASRYKVVTKAINDKFWGIRNDTKHSLYVGSYGRNTAIDSSDVDILIELPGDKFEAIKFNKGNIQSQLLQTLKNALPYTTSDVRADGQVVKINFTDGIKFEILPAFSQQEPYYGFKGYEYPDSNMGGHWKSTDPKSEQNAIKQKDIDTNKLCRNTCRHIREIRDSYFKSYHLSGIIIDSFVYNNIDNWKFVPSGSSSAAPGEYEKHLYSRLNNINVLYSPGSNQLIFVDEDSIYCLRKILEKMYS